MNDKELIEKMNRNLGKKNSVKKIPVKFVNKECKEKELIDKLNNNLEGEEEDCCGNCYDCGCDCEFKCPSLDNGNTIYEIEEDKESKKDEEQIEKFKEAKKVLNSGEYKFPSRHTDYTTLAKEKLEPNEYANPYKVFDFVRSKELMDKIDCMDKGVPFTKKCNNLIDELMNGCNVDEMITKVKEEIEKRKAEKNKKANEVWGFIRNNMFSMENYMDIFNNQEITVNELNTLFKKYIDVWNLLKETV